MLYGKNHFSSGNTDTIAEPLLCYPPLHAYFLVWTCFEQLEKRFAQKEKKKKNKKSRALCLNFVRLEFFLPNFLAAWNFG